MLQRSIRRLYMSAATKSETSHSHSRESSFVSILSGWAQQGVQGFFATQRILLDLAMRQNANVMHAVQQQLTDPHHSPTAILGEMAGESVTNFIEGQKILLELGKQQNEILMGAMTERVGDYPAAKATAELLRRSVDTFIHMQEEFLKIAGKQTHSWVEAAKAGRPYEPSHVVGLAREAVENFAKTQKQFLDVIVEETGKITSGKHSNGAAKIKKTELAELTRQVSEAFIEAQKKLVDVAGKQVNDNVKTAGKSLDLLQPFPFLPLAELTREGVKSYVDAQKALMDVVVKTAVEHKAPGKPATGTHRPRHAKKATAAA
jgi:hypothetical protein